MRAGARCVLRHPSEATGAAATIAGVCATLSLRAFLPSGDSGGCNPSSLHLHSIRELRPIGPPCPRRVATSFVLLPLSLSLSATSSSSSPVGPFNPLILFVFPVSLIVLIFLPSWLSYFYDALVLPLNFHVPLFCSHLHFILLVVFLFPTSTVSSLHSFLYFGTSSSSVPTRDSLF